MEMKQEEHNNNTNWLEVLYGTVPMELSQCHLSVGNCPNVTLLYGTVPMSPCCMELSQCHLSVWNCPNVTFLYGTVPMSPCCMELSQWNCPNVTLLYGTVQMFDGYFQPLVRPCLFWQSHTHIHYIRLHWHLSFCDIGNGHWSTGQVINQST